jgi:hypothetical protein
MTLSLEEMKANRRKWVEALRSGKYEQGKNNLYCEGRYCCLGVLALLAGYDAGEIEGQGTLGGREKALQFVGLRGAMGGFGHDDDRQFLADLNDEGTSFEEIADIIESNPPGLFIDSTPTGSAS